jgi:hypothetical protein
MDWYGSISDIVGERTHSSITPFSISFFPQQVSEKFDFMKVKRLPLFLSITLIIFPVRMWIFLLTDLVVSERFDLSTISHQSSQFRQIFCTQNITKDKLKYPKQFLLETLISGWSCGDRQEDTSFEHQSISSDRL